MIERINDNILIGRGQRLYSLDTFKTLACFMVVLLHYPIDGVIGVYLAALARIGVPFFFLVSGYFSYTEMYDQSRHIKRIKKYLFLLVGITAVYWFKDIARMAFGRITFADFLSSNFTWEFLILHIGSSGFMWFVRALLYIELLHMLIHKYLDSPKMKYVLVGLWIADILLIKYSFIFGFTIPQPYNEILTKMFGTAFLYYYIGRYIRHFANECSTKSFNVFRVIALMTVFVLLNFTEVYVLDNYLINQMPANYIMTFFLTVFIFLILLRYCNLGKGSIINFVGKDLSMYVYYWHVLVGMMMGSICSRIHIPEILYSNVITVFLASCLFGYVIFIVKRKFMVQKVRR